MLARNFRPAFALAVLLTSTLFIIFSITHLSPRAVKFVPPNPLHAATTESEAGNQALVKEKERQREKEKEKAAKKKGKIAAEKPLIPDAHFDWAKRREDYPILKESLIHLPDSNGTVVELPRIQYKFEVSPSEDYNTMNRDRRNVIKETMQRGWKGYKTFAWLKDELAVKSAKGKDGSGGWAATLVDALDTLWIMELTTEFEEAVEALELIDFSFSGESEINTFETNIRHLGGLLASHDLTQGKYPILLKKAIDLGDLLYACYDTPNRMPVTRWEWRNARDNRKQEAPGTILLAELGSMSLEFTRLSQLTGNPKYFDAIQRVQNELEKQQNSTQLPGMWPVTVNATGMDFKSGVEYTLSSMADSMYEYLPKQYMLLNGQSEQTRKMYEFAIETAKSNIIYRPMTKKKDEILLSGMMKVDSPTEKTLDSQGQHLSCYIGGMMGIGSQIFDRKDDLPIARKLLDGCLWAYDTTQSGIMPEVFHTVPCPENIECEWDEKIWLDEVLKRNSEAGFDAKNVKWKVLQHRFNPGFSDIPDRRYILRPEVIESVFTLYRITGAEDLRDRAWQLYSLINKLTATRYGNAAVADVTTGPYPEHVDSMESIWMAGTLKYFYLVFCDQNVLSLDDWVFNTEAHPFRRPGVKKLPLVEEKVAEKSP